MTTRTGRSQQTALRLPHELVEQLDAERERVAAENPGLEPSRADIIRMLLKQALDARKAPTPTSRRR